jgi:hypothetical protein
MWPWIRPCLERRLLEKRTTALPRLHTIRLLAERFAAEDQCDGTYEKYALQLLDYASKSPGGVQELLSWWLRYDSNYSPLTLLVAAIVTGTSAAAPSTVWYCLCGECRSALGSKYEAAVVTRNEYAIERLLLETDGPRNILRFGIKHAELHLVKRILEAKYPLADVKDMWNGTSKSANAKPQRFMRTEMLETPSVDIFELVLPELLDHGISPLSTRYLTSLLHTAACNGWTEMTKHLILRGAIFNQPGKRGSCSPVALEVACGEGHADVVRILLDNGAFCSHSGYNFSLAARRGHDATLRVLLETAPPPDSSQLGCALSNAARRGYADIVKILLDYGVDPNRGYIAPLIAAVKAEHVGIFRMLITKGANPWSVKDVERQRAEKMGVESMLVMLDEAAVERARLNYELISV